MNKQGPGKIEYCDWTWNPVVGCEHGCSYCFARKIAEHYRGTKGFPNGFTPTFRKDKLLEPKNLTNPSRIFVSDMGDLFGDWVPRDWIEAVIGAVLCAPQHTYLFLTKNPARYAEFNWPENCWLGTTITCQDDIWRVRELLNAKAKLLWLSVEPMLGLVDIIRYIGGQTHECKCGFHETEMDLHLFPGNKWYCPKCNTWCITRTAVSWVACGVQSGPDKKILHPDLQRSLRDQCQAAGVKFYLKSMYVDGKVVKMPLLDGKRWDEIPNSNINS